MTYKLAGFAALVLAAGLGIATAQEPAAPVRVSAQVALENRIKLAPPRYPQEAKQSRVQGTVRLDVIIDKAGKVARITVISGPAELRESAVDAVSQWEYKPILINGEPVDVVALVEINYTLN